MMLISFIQWLKGYLRLELRGAFQERFFNVCIHRGIYLWNVRHINSEHTTACISLPAFRKLAPICRKTKCYPHIVERKGFPFYISKYRGRYALLAGLLLCVVTVYAMTTFLWSVEIKGNEHISADEIMQRLEQAGLRVGMPRSSISPYDIERRFMKNITDISWIAINLDGAVANVEIIESKPVPPLVPEDVPCDIVASRYGVIQNIDAKTGVQMVGENDIVTEGQLLVSGVENTQMNGLVRRHAQAKAMAYTWYEKSMPVKTAETVWRMTGEKLTRFKLKILGRDLNLFFDKETPYENYAVVDNERKLSLGAEYVLPISLIKSEYLEAESAERALTQDEALRKALLSLYSEMDKETEHTMVLKRSHSLDKRQNGELVLSGLYECIEDIAKEVESEQQDTNTNKENHADTTNIY